MKCPECGYVSFDDLEACKKCGAAFNSPGEGQADEAEKSRLQKELFSLRLDDDFSSPSTEGPEKSELDTGPEVALEPGLESASEAEPEAEFRLDGFDEPATDEPATDEPVIDEPVVDESVVDEPVVDEPVVDEPVVDEPEEFERETGTGAEPLSLPSMAVDFDPAAMDAGTEDDAAMEFSEAETFGETAENGPGAPGPVIDDDADLPEDLWIEEGAGFTPRLAAFAVDSAIIAGLLGIFFFSAVLVLGAGGHGWSRIRTPAGSWALFVPFYLLSLFVSMCYHTFFPVWSGRTPGKAVMKLEIHRTDGGHMTYTRAFLRWVGYLVSLTFAGLGFLWIFIDERRRGWHDYLSGTWVKNLRDEHSDDV